MRQKKKKKKKKRDCKEDHKIQIITIIGEIVELGYTRSEIEQKATYDLCCSSYARDQYQFEFKI